MKKSQRVNTHISCVTRPATCCHNYISNKKRNYTVHQPLHLVSSLVNYSCWNFWSTCWRGETICRCLVRKYIKFEDQYKHNTGVLSHASVVLVLCGKRGSIGIIMLKKTHIGVLLAIRFSQRHVNLTRREVRLDEKTKLWAESDVNIVTTCNASALSLCEQWHRQQLMLVTPSVWTRWEIPTADFSNHTNLLFDRVYFAFVWLISPDHSFRISHFHPSLV